MQSNVTDIGFQLGNVFIHTHVCRKTKSLQIIIFMYVVSDMSYAAAYSVVVIVVTTVVSVQAASAAEEYNTCPHR